MTKCENEWWRGGIIYQIYPRSFQDTRGSGWGDLNGIRHRLPYIAALGVDAVWISPFFKSPMKDFGYDVVDHRHVDPMFGSDDDFAELIIEAKAHGIRIMVDLVLSHTSDQHPWFLDASRNKASEHSDCFVWVDPNDDGSPPNNWLSIFGGSAWTWNATRRQYYLHNFLSSQPDLNFHNPKVREEVLGIAKYWLDRGVGGFRLDTVNFYYHDQDLRNNPANLDRASALADESNPYSYQDHVFDKNRPEVTEFITELGSLMAQYPGTVTLGEIGAAQRRSWQLINDYTQEGRLNLCYSFDLLGPKFTAEHLRYVINRSMREAPNAWPCWAFSNHDVPRSASRLAPDGVDTRLIAKISSSILLSLRGTPCIYQGEELGLEEVFVPYERLQDPFGIEFWPDFVGRDGCRTPMPWESSARLGGFSRGEDTWLPVSESHCSMAVDCQETEPQSSLNTVRRIISLRSNEDCLKAGSLELMEGSSHLLAYRRVFENDQIYCYFNLSEEIISLPSPKDAVCSFDGRREGWSEIGPVINLQPWHWVWLKGRRNF